MGTAFGASGKHWTEAASKNNLKEYRKARFISKVTPDYVDFNFPRRPPLLHLLVLPSYIHQVICDGWAITFPGLTRSGWARCSRNSPQIKYWMPFGRRLSARPSSSLHQGSAESDCRAESLVS